MEGEEPRSESSKEKKKKCDVMSVLCMLQANIYSIYKFIIKYSTELTEKNLY